MSKKKKGIITAPGANTQAAPSQTTKCSKPESFEQAFLEPCELGSPWPELRPEDLSIEAYSDSIRQSHGTQKRYRLRIGASKRMLWIVLLVIAGGFAATHNRDFFKTIANLLLRTLR